MPRLFIAILPSGSLNKELSRVLNQVKNGLPNLTAGWVDYQQLHINLHFLNEIPQTQIPKIIDILDDLTNNHRPFNLTIRNLLGFPSLRHPKILAMGIQNSPPLNDLAYQVQLQLEKADITPAEERLYKPHLTLARIKVQLRGSEKQFLESFKYSSLFWPVTEFALLQSQLTPGGPIHKIIKTFKLSPSDPTIPITATSILNTLSLAAEEPAV